MLIHSLGQRAQNWNVMPRAKREAFMDNNSGDVAVQHGRAKGVLEAADKDRLINEGVQRPAQPAPLRTKSGPACGRRPRDNQHLEIGPVGVRASKSRRQHICRHPVALIIRLPLTKVEPE